MHSSQWMVVTIVALVMLGSIVKNYYQNREKTDFDKSNDANFQMMEKEILSLKHRVATLERIVTDNYQNVALDQAIDALRQPVQNAEVNPLV